jgi:SSS family solute:Na+ symporter
MAQNFWTAIYAWTACFLCTLLVSLVTRPRPDSELTGLVYSLTRRPRDDSARWFERPAVLAGVVLALALVLNVVFW